MSKIIEPTLTLQCTCGRKTKFKVGAKLICPCGLIVRLAWGLGDHTFTGLKHRDDA